MTRWMCGVVALVGMFPMAASAASVKASSEFKDAAGQKHTADKAFDGQLSTGWAESQLDAGEGSWLEVKLDRAMPITSVSFWPGHLEDGSRTLKESGRPKLVTITLTTATGPVSAQVRVVEGEEPLPQRVDVPIVGDATVVRVTIDEAFEGPVFNNTWIAEVALNFTGGEVPDAVEKAVKWQGTAAAEAAAEKNKKQIVTWFEAIGASEFGDSDLLKKIMWQAAEGAPFMRDRSRSVPYGFRVHAVPPDDVAVDALLKLKDPNAIPALEMASLRTTGKESKELADRVEYFYAYQELIGGGNRNVPNWAEPGWWPGALRGFGEPLAISIDPFGDLYVADVANHRVQRFDPKGKMTKAWGGELGITNVWFDDGRKYYVSGALPGKKKGLFTHPLDVAVIPGKTASGFVAVDSLGRVQVVGEDGAVATQWEIELDGELQAGVGGEGYIEVIAGKVLVVLGNEAYVYSLKGEEKAHWRVEDGSPKGSVPLPGGKVGFLFGDQLVMYSLDGFRHGSLLSEDARGDGFESWDMSADEKGKLWAITDTGMAVKYKKPGKVDYSVKFSDKPLFVPRFAVFDDVLFISEGDHLRRVDALELKRKADLAAGVSEKKTKGRK